jgi:hypothetical protein
MTPQERQLIDDLFDRLAKLESAKRDPEAMSAIMQGLRNAPNAVYALVQTALVQDEALKRADMRIQELEAVADQSQQNQSGGFLDSMRGAIFGQNQSQGASHGSVPNVRAPEIAGGGRPTWNTGQVLQQGQAPGQFTQPAYAQPQPYGAQQSPFGDSAGHSGGIEDRRPSGDQSGGELARDAGINDIGSSGRRADNSDNDSGSRQGFFDQASHDDDDDLDHDSDGFDGDSDSDYA